MIDVAITELARTLHASDHGGAPWSSESEAAPYLTEAAQMINDCPALATSYAMHGIHTENREKSA